MILFRTRRPGYRTLGLLLALMLVSGILSAAVPAGADGVPAAAGALLDAGTVVNAKMKTLAAGTDTQYHARTDQIKAIRMADSLPDGFAPSEANTVSAADSAYPVYIFFDNRDDAGILYFWTEGGTIAMHPDSACLFSNHTALTDISGIAGWDASRVAYMYGMFMGDVSLPDALALRDWDTSSVTDMRFMFYRATAMLFIDVSGWNTSKVWSMEGMFAVGDNWKANGQLREIAGLGNLDVSNVTDMTCMFYGAGQMMYYDIGGWDVSKVTSMNHMFCDNRELRSLDLSKWDVSSLRTVYCMFDDNVKLTTIGDVSHWNTVNLIDAGAWLNECCSFVGDNTGTLDLSGWDTRNLKSTGEMFVRTKIRTIDLTGWTFESMTNDGWEDAGRGIYYEFGNMMEESRGFGRMFDGATQLRMVWVSQEGYDTFNAAVERGVNTQNMWRHAKTEVFAIR